MQKWTEIEDRFRRRVEVKSGRIHEAKAMCGYCTKEEPMPMKWKLDK